GPIPSPGSTTSLACMVRSPISEPIRLGQGPKHAAPCVMICAALRYAAGMVLMSPELRAQLHGALGSELKSIAPASGGDINDAYRVTRADGRRLFIKANRAAPTDMFDREAAGLEFLRRGLGAARVIIPEVVHVGETFLVLEL